MDIEKGKECTMKTDLSVFENMRWEEEVSGVVEISMYASGTADQVRDIIVRFEPTVISDSQTYTRDERCLQMPKRANSNMMLTDSRNGDEEIEEDEAGTWLGDMWESSTTPADIEFDVEPKIDLSAGRMVPGYSGRL
ncbi:uncharacterized protein BJ212DRAFT_1483826 [Suillus subaureus]|uniref:Uncharacterized protein n=1 Tax=Suillus subaureus TaxID=48587 RepID=A0A9P7E582_9AGAM|nr:uncharacterized protein BJ212DRAFT_1483826 [Suillus subaureus]KAG1811163.1 hypothetical protein BJ212DRAFT_1483826 [Suillus subaureus]